MHTYRKSKNEPLWTVGYWADTALMAAATSAHVWHPLRDFNTEKAAASYTNYLNGGDGLYFPEEQ